VHDDLGRQEDVMSRTMRNRLGAAVMFTQFGAGSSSGTGPVSPTVLATSMCVMSEPGVGSLELLVLWRGRAGWYWRNRGQGGGVSSGGGGGMEAPGGREVRTEWISQGGVQLSLKFEPDSRTLWLLDQEVALGHDNVVLVDGVDDADGPRVVGTRRIEPAFDTAIDLPPGMAAGPPGVRLPAAVPAQTFIRRSPELVAFLQCDLRVPEASQYEQQAIKLWCAWVTEP
jgi:hypothetical protein